MKILLSLGFLSLACVAQAGEKFDLSSEWKPGATFVESMDLTQVLGIPRHGEAKATTQLTFGIKAGKISKSGGPALTLSPEKMKLQVDMPAPLGDIEFDSMDPNSGNEDVAKLYGSLQKSPPILDLNERGETKAIRGLDSLDEINPLLARFLGPESLRLLIQQAWLLELPAKPGEAGQSWPFETKFPTPVGSLRIRGRYELVGRREVNGVSCAEIALSGEVMGDFTQPVSTAEPDPEVQRLQLMMLAMGVKVKEGSMRGTIFHDLAAKHVIASEVDTSIRLSVEKYLENGKPTEIPIRQNIKLKIAESK